nr:MAG TPA: hypothetical protein [Caudoviricetes sp.]
MFNYSINTTTKAGRPRRSCPGHTKTGMRW